jgi:hypothetical protein
MTIDTHPALELDRQIKEARAAGQPRRLLLGQLLSRMSDRKLYRQIPRKEDPDETYPNFAAYLRREGVKMSPGEASDSIFIATELLPFVEEKLAMAEADIMSIQPSNLRTVTSLLRTAIKHNEANEVAAWLQKARVSTVQELTDEKNRSFGIVAPAPVEFEVTSLPTGQVRLQAVLPKKDWAYWMERGKVIISVNGARTSREEAKPNL